MTLRDEGSFDDAWERIGPDSLGILGACATVMRDTREVTIDHGAIDLLADRLVATDVEAPPWDAELHFRGSGPDGDEQTAGWIFVLDALNFCFWGLGHDSDPGARWRIEHHGEHVNGYSALAIALTRAAEAGIPLWSPAWLAEVNSETLGTVILRPAQGSPPIPLLIERVAHLRELAAGLALARPDGDLIRSPRPFSTLIEGCQGSAITLVETIVALFPSFNDVAIWTPPNDPDRPLTLRFLKRAQILVSDLAGAVEGTSLGAFHDRNELTAFADYKVPQVLRRFGVLGYAPSLVDRLHRRELILAGSRTEIEIRAATIWACELIRQALADRGLILAATAIDWLLWNAGQDLPSDREPYHRTVTIFY
ncbi:MAG: queuosine salvage family protein [Chloroflexota bacterium]|nr:queuosine salvage family protein [Chloroflexota bacterium]